MRSIIVLLLLLGTVLALPGCIIVPRGESYYYGPPPYDYEGPYYYNPKDGHYYRYDGTRGEEQRQERKSDEQH